MLILLPLSLSLLVSRFQTAASEKSYVSDPNLNLTENFHKNGYAYEEYEVETADGYILGLFRINSGKITNNSTKYPVLLVHGLLTSAESFIFVGPNRSLPYLLSDRNYDVWLVNSRGTLNSRRHRTLNPDTDRDFWLFTWHEVGVYDLPAIIDFILTKTSKKKLFYIGHSQGTTAFFVMASERPEYNKKIQLSVQLAPTVFVNRTTIVALKFLSHFYRFVDIILYNLNEMEFMPFLSNEGFRSLTTKWCDDAMFTKYICWYLFDFLTGNHFDSMDRANLKYILKHFPASASMRQLLHYAQCVVHGDFGTYDFAVKLNTKLYNSTKRVQFNLTKVSSPVALMYGLNDDLSHEEDVLRLGNSIPNLVESYAVPEPRFTHDDFVIAKDIVPLVYNRIFELFLTYSTG